MRALTVTAAFAADHNERLEFLGDSVLGLACRPTAVPALGRSAEGDLSRVRAHLVRQDTCTAWRWSWACPRSCAWARARPLGRRNAPSILADALEAIIGAVYLDAGFDAAAPGAPLVRAGGNPTRHVGCGQGRQDRLAGMAAGAQDAVPQYRWPATLGAAHRRPLRWPVTWPSWACTRGSLAAGRLAPRRRAGRAALPAMLPKGKPTWWWSKNHEAPSGLPYFRHTLSKPAAPTSAPAATDELNPSLDCHAVHPERRDAAQALLARRNAAA
jgi:ribonuclease-3